MEEVWAFDAVKEYGLPARDEQIAAYQALINRCREQNPDQLDTGGYYKTIVSGAIQAFGWDMFLMALSEPAAMECWAATDVEAVIQHDDFVWSEGAFMNPEIYRNASPIPPAQDLTAARGGIASKPESRRKGRGDRRHLELDK